MRIILSTFILCVLALASCDSSKKTTQNKADNVKQETVSEVKKEMKTPGVISFEAANTRYSAEGKFNNWSFTDARMKGQNVETLKATAEIDLTSIWEKNEKLTAHLKADDYFHVAKYTTAIMNISNVRAKGDKYVADLELKMRGGVQKMESEFEVVSYNPLKVKGSAMVDRSAFTLAMQNTSVPNEIKVSYNTIIPM